MSARGSEFRSCDEQEEQDAVDVDKNKLRKSVAGVVVSLCMGCVVALQTSFNGALAKPLKSPLAASTISFAGGVVVLSACFWATFGEEKPKNCKPVPWYLWICGGLLGAVIITMGAFLGPILGYSLYSVAFLSGELGCSLLIDFFGWFDVPKSAFQRKKLVAVFLVLIGAILSAVENFSVSAGNVGLVLLYFLLGIFSGSCAPVQVSLNSEFTNRFGTFPHRTALLSFSVGLTTIGCIWGIAILADPSIRDPQFQETEWWMYLGGVLGASYLVSAITLVPGWVTVPIFFVSVTAGQLTMSLLIDGLGLFAASKVTIYPLRYAGVAIAFVGAVGYNFFPEKWLHVCDRKKKNEDDHHGSQQQDFITQEMVRQ